ncbi:MAG TPA: D-alanyl-D-alanine carboxypeptidase, partial [Firmicutes bacterium]|nr:D-alanyl-D-alanine carboxypeptidase [Bacillota bacterium]
LRTKLWAIIILSIFLSLGAAADALELGSKAAILMDPYSGRVFLEHNVEEQIPVASISKLMTLVLILEAVERGELEPDHIITASPYAASKRGTRIWLEAGEQFTLEELLFAIAVGSANDAAVAVAEYIAGSEDSFVELMNQRAAELGLTQSTFVNCTGLPVQEGSPNLMSARDVGILAAHALRVPGLMEYVSTYEYTMRPETTKIPVLWNANRLLRRYYGVDGLKTGFTTEAGYCIAVTAQREQLRLLAVTLGHEKEADRESEARALLDFGFRKYQSVLLYPRGAEVAALECPNGEPRRVPVVLSADFYVTVERSKEMDLQTRVSLEHDLNAPLAEGITVGRICAFFAEDPVGEGLLTIGEPVRKAALGTLIVRLGKALAQSIY